MISSGDFPALATGRPQISFIAALHNLGRSDGLMYRASIFLRHIVEMSNRVGLECEVVLVEWNPPSNMSRARSALILPCELGCVSVRLITVPAEAHHSLVGAEKAPFFESVAKNVGLRRALGEFVLFTNPDVVFTPEVYEFLAAQPLDRAALYRMDRYDVGADLPVEATVDEQLAFCSRNVAGLHAMHATVHYDAPQNADELNGEHTLYGQLLREYQRILEDPSYKSPHEQSLIFPVDGIHTNASGCFLLMHRSRWQEVNGFAEFAAHMHTDSVTCWSAISAGARQVILEAPCRMFHLPHSRDYSAIWPKVDWHAWYERFLCARSLSDPLLINDEQWGFAGWEFEEWEACFENGDGWRQTVSCPIASETAPLLVD